MKNLNVKIRNLTQGLRELTSQVDELAALVLEQEHSEAEKLGSRNYPTHGIYNRVPVELDETTRPKAAQYNKSIDSAIVSLVASKGPQFKFTVRDISERTKLPFHTVAGHMKTLAELGKLTGHPDGYTARNLEHFRTKVENGDLFYHVTGLGWVEV